MCEASISDITSTFMISLNTVLVSLSSSIFVIFIQGFKMASCKYITLTLRKALHLYDRFGLNQISWSLINFIDTNDLEREMKLKVR